MSGKGDKPRPVNRKVYEDNFDVIFGERLPWWLRRKKKKNKKIIKNLKKQ